MNKSWPLCLSKRELKEVRPLADVLEVFAEDLLTYYRPDWDEQTPSLCREWYLRREAGLDAFVRYEAGLRLKHFANDGLLTGADYCEARLQETFFNLGWREAMSTCPTQWSAFIEWRKMTAPSFAQKLQVWTTRSHRHALARHSPDSRIRLYALLYDRALVPLEFCSEAWSAHTVNHVVTQEDWPGKKTVANRESIRRWRRNLGLKL